MLVMKHDKDPAQELVEKLGDLSGVQVFNNQVLCAIYIRPKTTAGGILLPDQTRDEDRFQGKVALVVMRGTTAFNDPEGRWFVDEKVDVGDWVFFRPSDGWAMQINGVECRMIDDTLIRGKISRPDQIW